MLLNNNIYILYQFSCFFSILFYKESLLYILFFSILLCTTFVAKHPVTKPNINVIKNSEKHLAEEIDRMFEDAVNTAEVIESITTNGRRTYNSEIVSIPGNYNIGEPDTALSERIAIVPPFGAEDVVKYILIAIAAVGVLGIGIFLIKRKVLRK